MTNEIIELLPSADLKAKIKDTNHQFTEDELLQIIYRYAPTFEVRLSLLERFSEIASPNVSALAKTYIEYEQEIFNRFIDAPEGFVYELCIKENPDSYEEKYLCSSYKDALICIDRFYEEYADFSKETEKTRYKILKRKIFSENDKFDEDAFAECVLGANKVVLEVSDYKNPADCELDTTCSECKEICPRRCDDVCFPCFAHEYAIIKYLDYQGKECLGINYCLGDCCNGLESEFYVLPFNSTTIKGRDYEGFFDHVHIELPLATLGSVEELDENMRKDYFDFVSYWSTKQS